MVLGVRVGGRCRVDTNGQIVPLGKAVLDRLSRLLELGKVAVRARKGWMVEFDKLAGFRGQILEDLRLLTAHHDLGAQLPLEFL